MAAIEKFIHQKIERVKLEGFEYQYAIVLDEGRRNSLPTGRVRGGRVEAAATSRLRQAGDAGPAYSRSRNPVRSIQAGLSRNH